MAQNGDQRAEEFCIKRFQPPRTPVHVFRLCRFCRKYGVAALHSNVDRLYRYLLDRDLDGAHSWINDYLSEAISGAQQIYEA